MLRAKNKDHNNEKLEVRALVADRKLIELGSEVSELLAEIAQAEKRVAHREGWISHLNVHLEQIPIEMQEMKERDEQYRAEQYAAKEQRDEARRKEIQKEIKDLEPEVKKAWERANKEHLKTLSWRDKRLAKTWEGRHILNPNPDHPFTMIAMQLQERLQKLKYEFHNVDMPTPNLLTPVDYSGFQRREIALRDLINNFDKRRNEGRSCPCGVKLDDNPPS